MNLDEVYRQINWRSFYSKFLSDFKESSGNLMARCPFHDDRHASLSINLETGLWKCHACGAQGNAQVFLERSGYTKERAIEYLKKEAGVTDEPKKGKRQTPKFTVEDYAQIKKLPVDFLRQLGLTNGKVGITIPYMDESGATVANRQRYGPGTSGPRFTWSRGSKVTLYGLWKLSWIREQGHVVLVEGESDTQTLWYHNVPALGVPGASVFQSAWVQLLQGLTIYVHQEPDQGGETFVRKVSEGLVAGHFRGEVYVLSLEGTGKKDPSELHVDNPASFVNKWRIVMDNARKLNIKEVAIKPEEIIPGAPVQLRMPTGYRVTERGVFIVKDEGLVNICPVPLLLSRRLRSVDTGEEKIEIVFQRDGSWHRITAQRSVVFQTRSITCLADRGLPVTSERAKSLVRFLGDLEAENLELLEVSRSVERMGWIDNKTFFPGIENDVVLDVDNGFRGIAEAYHQKGDYEEWKREISIARKYDLARFVIAASFASPLLKVLNHRVFLTHIWGPSRGGKTAVLKAAISVWGNPDELMASFNATKVGLERMAAFYSDLPLAVDERQVVGDKQGFIESLVYMFGLGKGKTRGTKGGGLQTGSSWRSIMLTTGEEPLSTESSQTGIKTRALELYGTPIGNEGEARRLHMVTSKNYGFAGPEFVKRLLREPDSLSEDYEALIEYLQNQAPDNMGSHITAVALVCVADYYSSKWIFGVDEDKAFEESMELAGRILSMLETVKEADLAERAQEFITGWILSNQDRFDKGAYEAKSPAPHYGLISSDEDVVYIVPEYLENALKQGGFSPRRVFQDLSDRSLIMTEKEVTTGKVRYKIRKTWRGKVARFIGFCTKTEFVEQEKLF